MAIGFYTDKEGRKRPISGRRGGRHHRVTGGHKLIMHKDIDVKSYPLYTKLDEPHPDTRVHNVFVGKRLPKKEYQAVEMLDHKELAIFAKNRNEADAIKSILDERGALRHRYHFSEADYNAGTSPMFTYKASEK